MKRVLVPVFLLLYWDIFDHSQSIDQPFYKFHREPFVPEVFTTRGLTGHTIDQLLDNFEPDENTTWKMRYFANDHFYKIGGPIFIVVGGEWEISPNAILAGHTVDMAKEFNGYLFYTQHRFYGASRPTMNISTRSLQFLTSMQALADLAHFIQTQKEVLKAPKSPIILVGYSYAGSLVTWFSHIYPDLVTGAWASSAPINAQTNFPEFFEAIEMALQHVGGDNCLERFYTIFDEMYERVKWGDTRSLSQKLNLCKNIGEKEVEHFYFFTLMIDEVAIEVQYYGTEGITNVCNYILNTPRDSDILDGFANFLKNRYNPCMNGDLNAAIAILKDPSWPNNSTGNMRQWFYQTCNEFGWFRTYKNLIPLEFFPIICQESFGDDFTLSKTDANVGVTNEIYGKFFPNVKNVYSTHGQVDPWIGLGTQDDLSPDSPTTILPLRSHCSDLHSIRATDPPEVIASKRKIRDLVKYWIAEKNSQMH